MVASDIRLVWEGRLGSAAVRVSREHGGLSNVVQPKIEEYHSLQPNTGPCVWRNTISERLNVGFETVPCLNSFLLQQFFHKIWIVAPLGSRANLLAADENVVRVGEVRIFRIRHGVEGTNSHRILVQHEKVRSVLFFYNFTQGQFLTGGLSFQ